MQVLLIRCKTIEFQIFVKQTRFVFLDDSNIFRTFQNEMFLLLTIWQESIYPIPSSDSLMFQQFRQNPWFEHFLCLIQRSFGQALDPANQLVNLDQNWPFGPRVEQLLDPWPDKAAWRSSLLRFFNFMIKWEDNSSIPWITYSTSFPILPEWAMKSYFSMIPPKAKKNM